MERLFIAHSANPHGRVETMREHLRDVSKRAAEFASAFGASEEAAMAGTLHDLGKYSCLFQRRLIGLEKGVDHWSSGAWAALAKY
ncbi:MAG: CRISPR-associated endonuclease Cas3'' [Thermodesulfobacteriota bacterium]